MAHWHSRFEGFRYGGGPSKSGLQTEGLTGACRNWTCEVCTSTETGNSNTGNKCQERTFSLMAVGIKNATLEDSLAGFFFFTKVNIVLLYNPVTMFLTVYKN